MIGDATQDTDAINPPAAPQPTPEPAPEPPKPVDPPNPYDDLVGQVAGARKALLASSLNGAVREDPNRQAKVLALSDKLGLTADVVGKNYDALSQRVALQDADYNRLLTHHPELASWLSIPSNAAVAHDDIHVLSELDRQFKALANPQSDVAGVLPDGYRFLPDGKIRGPLSADGKSEPVTYKSLDALRAKFERESSQQDNDRELAEQAAEVLRQNHPWAPNLMASAEASAASTTAALASMFGRDVTGQTQEGVVNGMTASDYRTGAQQLLAGSEELKPGFVGGATRTIGQLIGDAPLYLLGGEFAAPVTAIGKAIGLVGETSAAVPTIAKSEYLADVFRTAAAYAPIGARSGINTGADEGAGYGTVDALINTFGPAAFGSHLGLANALLPGRETVAGSWAGVAGRLIKHSGSQAAAMATTELANAIHEYASGSNPNALDREQLMPRLGQAGAMGALMSAAFQLPHQAAEHIRQQQVSAFAALSHADQLGAIIETAKATKVPERTSARFEELVKSMVPEESQTVYFQKEDWERAAEGAGMKPDDLAAAMNAEQEWRIAQTTGKAMEVRTAKVVTVATGMEDPAAIKSLLMNYRSAPNGKNGEEGAQFYKDTPQEIERQLGEITKGAKADSVSESDPIYQDVLGQTLDAGRPKQEAESIARLIASQFNTLAARENAGAEERGAAKIDPLEAYQQYKLRIAHESTIPKPDAVDAFLNRLRKGDVPTEKQVSGESLLEFLRKRGVNDEGGELAAMDADAARQPGQQSLINPEGRAYDHAAEAAYEAGYIDDKEEPTLLAAISNELAGRPVYAAGAEDPHLGPIRGALLELESTLKRHGIDLGKDESENARIKAALEKAEGVPLAEYQQRLEVPSAHLRHEYLLKQWKKAHGDRSPTPTDKDWQKLVRQADMVDEAQGRKFFQKDDTDARGSLSYNAERHFLITLTGKANLSTTLHEAGHFWLEVMGDHAQREGASEALKSDYAKILDFLGADKREDIETKHHEKFARAIEQYLMEGHAPSPELRPVFQRFMLWMTDLYRQVKSLVTLTPEVRRVFDRMLATDDAIKRAESEGMGSTIFPDRESSGMNEREWSAYMRETQDSRDSMRARVFNAAMATLRRERTRAYRAEKADVLKEAEAIVSRRPVHIAESYLVDGVGPDGKDLPEKPKLDRDEIEREFGKGTIHLLPRGITAEEGMPLQTAADLFGFRNGRELWEALRNLPDRKAEAKALADGILKARHPETTDEALLEKAQEAVHANDAQADVLSRESTALALKANRRATPQALLKATADRIIATTNHKDVRPDLYLHAERKASREAAEAFLKDDYTGAFLAKQREELSHHLVKAAQAAQEVIGKTDELMRRVKKTDTRAMLGKAGGKSWLVRSPDGSAAEAFNTESEAQNYAKEVGGSVAAGPGYQETVDALRAQWDDTAERAQWDYGTLKQVYDAVRSTVHRARQEFTVMEEGRKAKLAEVVAKGMEAQKATGKTAIRPFIKGGLSYLAKRFVRQLDALNRTMAAVAKEMDGEKDGGWHWEHIVRPMNEAANEETAMRIADNVRMQEIFREHGKRGRYQEKVHIPAIGDYLSLENRIAVALNSGSTRNLERLMRNPGAGHGQWTREQVEAINHTLDEKDWAFVKSVWSHFDQKWPAIEALEKKLNGIAPEKRDSIPVSTRFGTIDGKYYPIVYDPEGVARAVEIGLDKPRNPLFAMPRSGFTERTVASTGLPLKLDLGAIFRHNNDVAHFLSHAEKLASVNRIINDTQFIQGTVERFGRESYDVIRDRIRAIAQGNQGPQNAWERALKFMRLRSGAATMGFNVMSATSHAFGLSQSMKAVGAGRYLAASGKYFASAASADSAKAFILAKSQFMKNMAHTLTTESVETINQGAAGGTARWFRDHAYSLMHVMLWHINSPTWLAAYDHAMEENPKDEARAIALADQKVKDTQGSGLTVDMTRAQDMNELTKLFMQYSAFFTRTYQAMRPAVVGAKLSDPASLGRLAWDTAVLVSLPVVIEATFHQLVKPSPENDNSAEWWAKELAKDHLGYLLGTFIGGRELSSAIKGYDYKGPGGLRTIAQISALLKDAFDDKSHPAGKVARSAFLLTGNAFGLPVNQLDHLIQGYLWDSEHGTANPAPLIYGPPPRH